MSSLKRIDLNSSNLEQEIFEVVQHVVPSWRDKVDFKRVSFKTLSGGLTNKIVQISSNNSDDNSNNNNVDNGSLAPTERRIVVRLFGLNTEILIDRQAEVVNIRRVHAAGLGAKLYGTFGNGLVVEWLDGATLDLPHRCTAHARQIAHELAKWHKNLKPLKEEKAMVFDLIRHWIGLIPIEYAKEAQRTQLRASTLSIDALNRELALLKSHLQRADQTVVFCHNDLLPGNILFDEATNRLTFLDVEYGAYNYRCFDIGNHWNELTWNGEKLVDSLFPDEDLQWRWCRYYLEFCNNVDSQVNNTVTDEEIERLRISSLYFSLCSELFWISWALVQCSVSLINFDYLSWGIERFERYQRNRDRYLALL